MRTRIHDKNFLDLIRGASLFTTGGGIPYEDQVKALKRVRKIDASLLSLNEFPADSYICTAAELGPTDVPPLKKEKVISDMFDVLQKATGKKIAGIYPPEIGQESVVLETSYYLNKPIADFDPVGFRAVPYIDITIQNVKNLKSGYTPMVVATDRNEIFLITGKKITNERLETILRGMTSFSKVGVVFLLGGVMSVNELKRNNISSASYSKALQFGQITTADELLKALNPKKLLHATVVKKEEFKQKGFLGERVVVIDENKKMFTLIILNEVLFLLDERNKVLASVPERILMIDTKKLQGVSGVFLEKGKRFTLAVIPPEKEWQNKRAEKIFGKERFKDLLLKE